MWLVVGCWLMKNEKEDQCVEFDRLHPDHRFSSHLSFLPLKFRRAKFERSSFEPFKPMNVNLREMHSMPSTELCCTKTGAAYDS